MIADFLGPYAALRQAWTDGTRADADRQSDFRAVFGTEQGQRVLLELMTWAHVIEPVASDDTVALQRAEGMRGLIYVILRQLSAEPLPDRKSLNHRI